VVTGIQNKSSIRIGDPLMLNLTNVGGICEENVYVE
jgi:hypothetical protein